MVGGSIVFKGKRILVTGATGLIGSHLVTELLAANADVVAMGRKEERIRSVFHNEIKNKHFSYVIGNISNGINSSIGIFDYIFHAASPISGAEIKLNPVDTISANLDGTRTCLEYLKNQKAMGRMIVFSSATVYGNQYTENVTFIEDETDKADALHTGNSPYSESKRMIEVLARSYYTQYQVDSVIVRIGYVYGFSNPKPNTAFYEFIGRVLNREDVILNNSGMGRRDNINVDDVVNGLMIVAKNGISGEAYNLSSNGEKNNFRAIDEIAEIIVDTANYLDKDSKIKAIIKPMEGDRKPGMKLDNTKVKELGWNINVTLEDGIRDTIEKYMR
jgi:nucleoside-diphosphate-sugar epimerase